MRRVAKYPLLEDCGKTKQSEWSSLTSGPGRASVPLFSASSRRHGKINPDQASKSVVR
jgi:hypothetical protein